MTNDLNATSLNEHILEMMKSYDLEPIRGHLDLVGSGQLDEVYNRTGRPNQYYQWLACLVRHLQPQQVVELGAAAGISTLIMATEMPKDGKLYSVDNDPAAWRWMVNQYQQVTKILADDLDMSIWDGVDLAATDLWFIDSLHTEEQLRKELELYAPYFKKGTIVVLDDIHLHEGMKRIWESIKHDKCDNTVPCHYSGFGFFII